jgi:hypothetical protein
MKDEYTIVSAKKAAMLIEKVNILIGLGWYPIGAAFKEEKKWHQTMCKYDNGDADDDSDDGDQPPVTNVPPSGGFFMLVA